VKLAIFGSPVAQSLSPAMHRAAFDHIGREGDYEARDVDPAGFRAGVVELRAGLLGGANVTMPLKMAAYDVCDELSTRATRAGAVNTLFMRGSLLWGDNTDIAGIEFAWAEAGLPEEGPVVILGAGGAAAAAQVALAGRDVRVVARRPLAAQNVVDRVGVGASVIRWGEPVPPGVLVNATSLGMRGETLPAYLLDSATGILDMAYADVPTTAVAELESRGLPVADGLDMLVGQAVGSFLTWTGVEVGPDVFRTAAQGELRRRAG